jgi:hypothetical protein
MWVGEIMTFVATPIIFPCFVFSPIEKKYLKENKTSLQAIVD